MRIGLVGKCVVETSIKKVAELVGRLWAASFCFAIISFLMCNSIDLVRAENASQIDGAAPLIPYKYISNENIDPFLWKGKNPSDAKIARALPDLAATISKFYDVRDCLKSSERDKIKPDLTQVDWLAVNEEEHGVEVCVFRIMSSFADLVAAERWLKSQGLIVRVSNWSKFSDGEVYKSSRISGSNSSLKNGLKIYIKEPSIWDWFQPTINAETISVYWTKEFNVQSVSFVLSVK